MNIGDKMVVTLNYRLTVNENGNETEIEKTDVTHPFVFLFGSEQVLPEFEINLAGKAVGESFDFFINPENAYGKSNPQNVVNVPISIFHDKTGSPDPNLLTVGNVLPMMDNAGNKYSGLVKEVHSDHVLMDFNHPLADKKLHFTGEVVDIRSASPEELEHGHVHGPEGHHH